jgi:hypothetical protein
MLVAMGKILRDLVLAGRSWGWARQGKKKAGWVLAGAMLAGLPSLSFATSTPAPRDFVNSMVTHEKEAELHRDHYAYTSHERSERTGEHLWMERVAETTAGKVRLLLAEDGKALSGDRLAAERARMADIVAHPNAFQRRSQALKDDEQHALKMLDLLPKAFIFENERQEGQFVRIDFRPNPDYAPQSLEERVLHAMTGSLLVDPDVMRLRGIEARLSEDVNIGFGLIATIKAGSNFDTTRELVYGNEWKTQTLDTDINGRAIFFKAIGRKEHAEHSDFKLLPHEMTVAQAVEMLEQ